MNCLTFSILFWLTFSWTNNKGAKQLCDFRRALTMFRFCEKENLFYICEGVSFQPFAHTFPLKVKCHEKKFRRGKWEGKESLSLAFMRLQSKLSLSFALYYSFCTFAFSHLFSFCFVCFILLPFIFHSFVFFYLSFQWLSILIYLYSSPVSDLIVRLLFSYIIH